MCKGFLVKTGMINLSHKGTIHTYFTLQRIIASDRYDGSGGLLSAASINPVLNIYNEYYCIV